MNNIVQYLIELNISITAFFLLYKLLFNKDSNFGIRRCFLLYALIGSALIPLFNISLTGDSFLYSANMIRLEELTVQGKSGDSFNTGPFSVTGFFYQVYLVVALFLFSRLIISVSNIIYSIIKGKKTAINGQDLYINSKLHASSFFKYIFIDPDKTEDIELKQIIAHEKQHVRLFHSFDRIFVEIFAAVSWINPVVWTLRKEIIINHEYQADNKIVEQGTDHASYQLTILNQYIGSASITNQFSNHIKNRIIMLNKNYKKGSFWKSIVLIPASLILMFFIACGNETENEEPQSGEKLMENVFYDVEKMPQWPGNDDFIMSVRNFIAKNLQYPTEATDNGVEGKVFITFMVTKTGKVIVPDPEMLPPEKNEDGSLKEMVVIGYRTLTDNSDMPDEKYINLLKEEGKRVIGLIPDLQPGEKGGVPVNALFTMPIIFKLN
ncbi:MAG: hypothetical protein K9J30_02360 [Bacteroidales bacterium]|nr:hypothetical protein [Bacteroidales bacterium]